MLTKTERFSFKNKKGRVLSARIDVPRTKPKFYGLYVHCFTCSKDLLPASRIGRFLAEQGIAVMRFDMTGLGESEGDFSETNFLTNLEDIECALEAMRLSGKTPQFIIGHSLGGTAALVAAERAADLKAVISINAPAHPRHVKKRFHNHESEIQSEGMAEVMIEGRPFVIKSHFIEALEAFDMHSVLKSLKAAVLVLHAPEDHVVHIENGFEIFSMAQNAKSFCLLPNADHLLTDTESCRYAAMMMGAWLKGYVTQTGESEALANVNADVYVSENGLGKFTQDVFMAGHAFRADEPEHMAGGLGSGPAPYDFLMAGLGACTSMTLRLYADHKKIPLSSIDVELRHHKVSSDTHESSDGSHSQKIDKIDVFERIIHIEGDLTEDQKSSILAIADKCPVHKTLTRPSLIKTTLK